MDEAELEEIVANIREMRKTVNESLRKEAGVV